MEWGGAHHPEAHFILYQKEKNLGPFSKDKAGEYSVRNQGDIYL